MNEFILGMSALALTIGESDLIGFSIVREVKEEERVHTASTSLQV